jgi:hypothetical protein
MFFYDPLEMNRREAEWTKESRPLPYPLVSDPLPMVAKGT